MTMVSHMQGGVKEACPSVCLPKCCALGEVGLESKRHEEDHGALSSGEGTPPPLPPSDSWDITVTSVCRDPSLHWWFREASERLR